MNIIAKSFPTPAQVQGRIDSNAFDGIELFVHPSIPLETQKQAIQLARDSFPVVNFETFYYVPVNDKKEIGCLISTNSGIRDATRRLLETAVELNQGLGNVNTHFAGCPVLSDEDIVKSPSLDEQLDMIGQHLAKYYPHVCLENVIPFDAIENKAIYSNGCDMTDFARMHQKFGIPMTLDTAHLAISLQQYALAVQKAEMLGRMPVAFSPERLRLGQQVLHQGLMKTWLEQISQLPYGAIRNLHFINAQVDDNGDYRDGYREFSQGNGRLLDLHQALPVLRNRKDAKYMVAEVVDALYSKTPDYDKAPEMAQMARELRAEMARLDASK